MVVEQAKKWLEETGRVEVLPNSLEWLLRTRQEQEKPGTQLKYSEQEFQEMVKQVRKTVLHELAHHLGMSHRKMKEIGL